MGRISTSRCGPASRSPASASKPIRRRWTRVPTGILTDNLRWAPSGTSIFVGGQDATVKQVLDCFESSAVNCNVPFKVDRMDPATLKLTEVVRSGVYGVMGAGTGAIQVGNHIWVSSFRADRIGVFPTR